MPDFFYEDFVPGSVAEFHADAPVTKEDIIRFAAAYDPQPFHLDEEAAKHSLLGGLCASGWHTSCLMMRLNFDTWLSRTASLGAPGIDEMRWEKPLRPGDRLTLRRTILHKRVSRNRPEMGLVSMEIDALNQKGDLIARQKHTQLISPRDPARALAEVSAAAPAAKVDHPTHALPRIAADGRARPFAGWLEDLQVGAYIELGRETFTKDNIIDFASHYDPQRFHLDEEEAARTHFGRLAASGWQTASLWMKNVVATRERVQGELRAQGIETPQGGPSPGFVHLRWPKPVLVGDTVTYATQIIDKRATSKPGWGLVFNHNTGVNQNGELVFEFRGSGFIRMRG
ncbi:MAG: MaoC family dehydratase [Rhodoblastus sp.]